MDEVRDPVSELGFEEPPRKKGIPTWVKVVLGLAVLAIVPCIGLLATLVVPSVMGSLVAAQQAKARADIAGLENALNDYAIENNGRYPATLDELLTSAPGQPPYLETETGALPLDPWGHPYRYVPPGPDGQYRILTLGADGAPGGSGTDQDIDQNSLRQGG